MAKLKTLIMLFLAMLSFAMLSVGASGNGKQAYPHMDRKHRRRLGVSPAEFYRVAIAEGHGVRGGAPTLVKCDGCDAEIDETERAEHVCPTNADALTKLEQAADALERKADLDTEAIKQEIRDDLIERIKDGDLVIETPSRTEHQRAEVRDRFDQMDWIDGDEELAMMLFESTWRMKHPTQKTPPEDLVRRWRSKMLTEGNEVGVADAETGKLTRALRIGDVEDYTDPEKFSRAMDSAESGFGSQLIGAQYISQLWEAARNEDSLVGDIRQIPMTDPTTYIPIDAGLPEMHFVGESTTEGASNYTTSKTGSNRVTLTAKKFTIQQIWSAELQEDSIIAFVPFLRQQLTSSVAVHTGSAFYNGDTTNAGTGNINSDDADPNDTKHYLAWDGIRHYWLVDTAAQGKDMAGALNPDEIWKARGKLSGQQDDVDAEIKTINWGKNARDLRAIMDFDTFMVMHRLGEVLTVDKYGPNATVVSGELGSYAGIPIISPPYASKTEADGKASGTEASNTKGQITIVNPMGFISGVRRDMQFFLDRIQRTDQFLVELFTRIAFVKHGENVAAGVYNISL